LVIRVLVLLLALAATTVPLASAGATQRAKVRIVSVNPVKASGRGFHARERVRLTVRTATARRFVRLRASTSGSFTAAVTGLGHFDPCLGPLIVTATGSQGSRATAKVPQRECAPSP
jgi:hypothetical protein